MLQRILISKSSLQALTPSYAFTYIHLRDIDKKINPKTSRIPYSYMDPRKSFEGVPVQPKWASTLPPRVRKHMDRVIFEEYKNKILMGTIDQEKKKEPDPLWGEHPMPLHFYQRLSHVQLKTVSHPQNRPFFKHLDALYLPHFQSALPLQTQVTTQLIQQAKFQDITQIALLLRQQTIRDRQLYYAIEKKIGTKFHLLTTQDLINLKFAFDGGDKYGYPQFHHILSDLLREDIPKMNKQQLMDLFYAGRHSNYGRVSVLPAILTQLEKRANELTEEDKYNFWFTFALCNQPLKKTESDYKVRHQFRNLAHRVLFKLQLPQTLTLNPHIASLLVYAFAKLRTINTKHITSQIFQYITANVDQFMQDRERVMVALVYLPEMQGGAGYFSQQLFQKLRDHAISQWAQYQKIDQVRMLHSLWNMRMWSDELLQLYKGIEVQVDVTLLYYFAQMQLSFPTQRQWQIITYIAYLDYIPAPYFQVFKRFYTFMKRITPWNLKPIEDKLFNTESYYNCLRYSDKFYNIRQFKQLIQNQKFLQIKYIDSCTPVENTEVTMFSIHKYQISIEIVNEVDYVPGTKILKESYRNKMRSLKNMGWIPLVIDQSNLQNKNAYQWLYQIISFPDEVIEPQLAIMAEVDQKRSDYLRIQSAHVEFVQMSDAKKQLYYNHRRGKPGLSFEFGHNNSPWSKLDFEAIYKNAFEILSLELGDESKDQIPVKLTPEEEKELRQAEMEDQNAEK